MIYTRPEPTTSPPDVRVIRDRGKVTCEYCGRTTKADNEICPSCGAVLNGLEE